MDCKIGLRRWSTLYYVMNRDKKLLNVDIIGYQKSLTVAEAEAISNHLQSRGKHAQTKHIYNDVKKSKSVVALD
ncbi:hypothetical protein SAMN05216436_106126 [bacterium A37T11]|nr:hypothetical protein SAMN05216436_106126 [bacterium A37T11]